MIKIKAGERTKRDILESGVRLWIPSNGNVTAHQIGMSIGITHSAILYHHGGNESNDVRQLLQKLLNRQPLAHKRLSLQGVNRLCLLQK